MKKINKKAKFNYKLFEKYEAGISLTGAEVKAIRKGNIDLSSAHAKVIDNQMYLINVNIGVENVGDSESTRTRKLLLHRRQIMSISSVSKAKKLTLIPTRVYTKGRLIKVELALAKAKRQFEKKEGIKKRDIEREIEQELRGKKE